MFPVLSKAPEPLFAAVSDKLPGTSEQVVETCVVSSPPFGRGYGSGFFPSLWEGLGEWFLPLPLGGVRGVVSSPPFGRG